MRSIRKGRKEIEKKWSMHLNSTYMRERGKMRGCVSTAEHKKRPMGR